MSSDSPGAVADKALYFALEYARAQPLTVAQRQPMEKYINTALQQQANPDSLRVVYEKIQSASLVLRAVEWTVLVDNTAGPKPAPAFEDLLEGIRRTTESFGAISETDTDWDELSIVATVARAADVLGRALSQESPQ